MSPRCPDLHTHSTASDGTLEPAALADLARASGVDCLALTDHDTLTGYMELRALGVADIRLVAGIEISARDENREFHVVGLAVDGAAPALTDLIEAQAARRRERAEAMASRLQAVGVEGASALADHPRRVPGRPHFARFLVAQGHADNVAQAFKRYLGRGQRAYVATAWPGLDEVVAAIQGAGGLAVLAHPLAYRMTATRLRRLVDRFVGAGGDAIEVVSGWQNRQATAFVAELIRARRMLASVGSDFHTPLGAHARPGRYAPAPDALDYVWDDPRFFG